MLRTARGGLLLVATLLLPGPARAQDKPPVPVPAPSPAPPPAPSPVPPPAAPPAAAPAPDADLPPEREVNRDARTDPRNQKPDAFPVIRRAEYLPALAARKMDPGEWVIGAVVGKSALAFPINILNRSEILVDEVDGVPFLVTWCPLCRTGTVHVRTLDGQVLDFGHSGLLYRSAFLLYEQKSKSLLHNATGTFLAGPLRGKRLETIPSRFVQWEVWRKSRPDTKVLAKDPLDLDQTVDGYDRRNRGLKLKFGLGIEAGGAERLYELDQLDVLPLVQETVGGVPLVVVFHPGTQTATAFERALDGKVLDLRRGEDGADGLPRLEETGEDRSVFQAVTGEGLSGPLKGKFLVPVPGCFWEVYAWTAHHPRGTMFRASVPPPQDLPDIPEGEDK